MAANQSTQESRWVDASVTEIRRAPSTDDERWHHIMIISETGGEGRLPIWIGPAEATALAMTLESTETPRPFTSTLAASLVTAAGAAITEVRITRLQPPVFYASVLVNGAAGAREVDARPSDAVTLALTAGAPIRIDSKLFESGHLPDWAERIAASPVVTADLVAEHMRRYTEALGEHEETT